MALGCVWRSESTGGAAFCSQVIARNDLRAMKSRVGLVDARPA